MSNNLAFYKQAIAANVGELILDRLKDPLVKDIMLNENGYLFEDVIGVGFREIGMLDAKTAEAFLLSVASFMGRDLNYYYPRLRGELPKEEPFHGERIEAMIYPIVEAPTFTIRKPMIKIMDLEDYVDAGQLSKAQMIAIETAITEQKTILVVGGTGSGKTTLLNAIIRKIVVLDSKCRLYIIQDTREIQSNYKNATFPRTTESLNMNDLLESGMRYNPTRIVVGELLGKECFTFMAATNTGHKGAISTIHANSPGDGLLRLCTLLETHGYKISKADIAAQINVLIFIERHIGEPKVKSIGLVEGYIAQHDKFIVNEKLFGS